MCLRSSDVCLNLNSSFSGRSCGGSVQDLQTGPLQGAVRSRPEDGGLHLLRGGRHQPAGQGKPVSGASLSAKLEPYLLQLRQEKRKKENTLMRVIQLE